MKEEDFFKHIKTKFVTSRPTLLKMFREVLQIERRKMILDQTLEYKTGRTPEMVKMKVFLALGE